MTRKLATRDARAIGARIARLESFETWGNFHGCPVTPNLAWLGDGGWLQGSALDRFRADRETIDYIVYSYYTPIQWHAANGWVRIGHNFSAISTKHQHSAAHYSYFLPADTRETVLQVSYGLSEAQRMMLRRIENQTMPVRARDITGQASRTLTVLYRLGLVEDTGTRLVVTEKGREVWS